MRILTNFVILAALSAYCSAEIVITRSYHEDRKGLGGKDLPPIDHAVVQWIGKDRMRIEEGTEVTIIRTDLKKAYRFDTKAKVFETIDLPIDVHKFIAKMPKQQADMVEEMFKAVKFTVTPTTETKKIKEWNATKYTLAIIPPGGEKVRVTADIWVTKDIPVDRAAFTALNCAYMDVQMGGVGGADAAAEWMKLDGVAVLLEREEKMIGEVHARDEALSIESKEAPEGLYEVPKDFKELPYDPTDSTPLGSPKHGHSKDGDAKAKPPTEKPKKSPPPPPTPPK